MTEARNVTGIITRSKTKSKDIRKSDRSPETKWGTSVSSDLDLACLEINCFSPENVSAVSVDKGSPHCTFHSPDPGNLYTVQCEVPESGSQSMKCVNFNSESGSYRTDSDTDTKSMDLPVCTNSRCEYGPSFLMVGLLFSQQNTTSVSIRGNISRIQS